MRRAASFLLLGCALAASAADIWRWKDADGVVHYSDQPAPGAERVNMGPVRRGEAAPQATPATEPPAPRAAPPRVPYTRCEVTAPENDESFFAVDAVDVALAVEPELQAGHHLQLLLNGTPYPGWPDGATTSTLTGLYRGSYTLEVRVLDERERIVCGGPVVNFHVRQPSVLSPARKPAPAPATKPPAPAPGK